MYSIHFLYQKVHCVRMQRISLTMASHLKQYLSAIRSMQISLGFPDPRDHNSPPALQRVQAGIRRAQMLKRSQPRVRLPITITILRQLKAALDQAANPNRVVLWAIACTAFFGFFHLGELLLHSKTEYYPGLGCGGYHHLMTRSQA